MVGYLHGKVLDRAEQGSDCVPSLDKATAGGREAVQDLHRQKHKQSLQSVDRLMAVQADRHSSITLTV